MNTHLAKILYVNAATSALLGLVLAVDAAPLAVWLVPWQGEVFGLGAEALTRLTGVGLLPFAALVAWAARNVAARRTAIAVIFVADVGWVLGSLLLLALAPHAFSALGLAAVAVGAAAVAVFAWFERVALVPAAG